MAEHAPQAKYRKDYRQPDFWIDTIDLTFELDDTATRVTAVSHIRRNGDHDRPLVLDGVGLTLCALAVDGKTLKSSDFQQDEVSLRLNPVPDHFTLQVETQIDPQANTLLEGLYISDGAFCTQCEAEGFRRITYFLDRPDVMAVYSTRIIADASRFPQLLANGNRMGQGSLSDGRHWVQWQDPFPKPSYLFALVAGDFDCLRDQFTTASGKPVTLEIFVDQGNLERAKYAMVSLKKAMRWEEEVYGREYDLAIYMIVAVDFFNMGAMENKGLNIFNSKYVLADPATATDQDYHDIESVIGHEYFHNWTGNRVTCRDWFQLSLKEGLTVFRDQEFSADMGSRAINRINAVRTIRTAQFAEDAGPMAHPIRPDQVIEMNNFYTVTVYNKGAEVIRMLHTLLGADSFRRGMDLYFSRHDGQAVTCDDFVQAMEDAAAVDLGQFRRWYSQSGTPTVTVRDHFDADTGRYQLDIQQHTPATADQADKQPLHIPFSVALYDRAGQLLSLQLADKAVHPVLDLRQARQTFAFDGLREKPIPALLQNFSAPVRVDYPYDEAQRVHLLRFARDPFCCWDAAQSLFSDYILKRAAARRQGNTLPVPDTLVEALRGLLADSSRDQALLAEILILPSEAELAEMQSEIDVDGLFEARQYLKKTIAEALQAPLWALFEATAQPGDYTLEQSAIAERQLRAVCLSYLALLATSHVNEVVEEHYRQSSSMTETLTALTAATQGGLPCSEALLAQFDSRWSHDPLVMDKWFALQATVPGPQTLARVQELMGHSAFQLGNPNRVRALIGSFAAGNAVAFHRLDGAGYRFIADTVIALNSLNPQTAARLVVPLTRWKRYDSNRQALMRTELDRIMATPSLARDLYEVVGRALAQ